MAYRISDDCINCGACEANCPMGAIYEEGAKRVIDPGKCIDCGGCANACPVGAPRA